MFTSTKSAPGRDRRRGAKWLPLMAACLPLTAGADVIAVFDEVADLTVTPIGVTYTAVTPEEIRTVYANDMASVHVAMYDAVVAVKGGYEPFYTTASSPAAGASCGVGLWWVLACGPLAAARLGSAPAAA